MKRFTFFLILLVSSMTMSYGTHLKGGQIVIKQLDNSTVRITLIAYTRYLDPQSVLFSQSGTGTLDFGDGSPVHHPPEQVGVQLYHDPFYGDVHYIEYSVEHAYAQGFYAVSYTESNLNAGILNIDNPVNTAFKMSAAFELDPTGHYESPSFPTPPIFTFQIGKPLSLSTATLDQTYYTYYDLRVPDLTMGYEFPDGFELNQNTGVITWDTKFKGHYFVGQYLFCVRITQFDASDHLVGWTDRVMDLTIDDKAVRVAAINPVTAPDGRIVVTEDQVKTIRLILRDTALVDSLRWSLAVSPEVAANSELTQYDSAANFYKFRIAVLTLHTTAEILRDKQYMISLRGSSYGSMRTGVDVNFLYFTKDVQLHAKPDLATGLEPHTMVNAEIYPNPFGQHVFVKGPFSAGAQVFFRDVLGRTAPLTSWITDEAVDTSRLPSGFYVLEVRDGMKWARVKVVRE